MYVIASLCILFSSANIFLISSVIFVISNSPFHFYYVVTFYTFSRDFRCLGRDFQTTKLGFSTHFAYFPLFRQRFPAGGAWFLYPFRRFSLFWVEIPGRRGLVSLPISPGFPVLGRDFRQVGLGISTFSQQKRLFRQRFPDDETWFLYPFRRFSCFRQRFPDVGTWFLYLFPGFPLFRQRFPASPRHSCTPRYGITHRYGDTSRCSFSIHFIVIIIFYKGNN